MSAAASKKAGSTSHAEVRLAWMFAAPALGAITIVVAFPMAWACWESLHRDDLRMPWLGHPFVGLANYREAFADQRFWSALGHTLAFTASTVTLELVLGLALALALNRAQRGTGMLRTAALLPWAIPTVVAALIWRFMFETPGGIVNTVLLGTGLFRSVPTWFGDARFAWVPVVLADVWKTTPFMALVLLAGLQGIDPALYEAAALDGAGPLRQTFEVTLPLLRPAIAGAVVFRCLDAFRVFDVIYVMTGGGPGTATEPLSLLAFRALFRDLRFGYGAALSVLIFLVSLALAVLWLALTRRAAEAA